ncbi:MAG: hypothetical protein WB646_14345 [Steroidobacteraceae bacterium]
MKRSPVLSLLLMGGIAALPDVGAAATQSQASLAMNRCVSAFMQSMAQHSMNVKLRQSRLLGPPSSPSLRTPAAADLVLTASDAHDNHTVARAICRLDARGQMIRLEEVSVAIDPMLD